MGKKLAFTMLISVLVSALIVTNVAAFTDINGHWAEPSIKWAHKKGIAKGYTNGTFKPNKSVSEAEFLSLLIRAYNPNDMSELKNKEHWADDTYTYAMKKNYPAQGANNISRRNTPISRENVAEIIAGTQGVNYRGRDAIHYLLGKGLAKGKSNGVISIDGYKGEDTLTRAESIEFIRNVLEKGIKDENGKPIMEKRPKQPSNKNDLPKLSTPPKNEPALPKPSPEPAPTPQQPTVPIGSVSGKELFDQTKDYANSLGYVISEYVNTTGRFAVGDGIPAGVHFIDRPEENVMTISVADWNNPNDMKLFTRLIENYGVDSSFIIDEMNNLKVDSGEKIQAQEVEFSIRKRNKSGRISTGLTIWYN